MPDPTELLSVARLLLDAPAPARTRQVQLRRAVSTAYYALFHQVLRGAAHRFVGESEELSGSYSLIYRSFDHQHMRRMCEELQISTLKGRIKSALRRTMFGQDTRDFASNFAALQELRHSADYDPTAYFFPSDVASLIIAAKDSTDAFDRIPADEKADVLALLMVRSRV